MKKVLLSFLLMVGLFANSALLSKKEINSVLKSSFIYPRIANQIKNGQIKVQAVKKDGFYVIKLYTPRGVGYVYVTADKKYTILGNVINNHTRAPLVGKFPINAQIVKEGVAFSFGKGPDLYVVTDPECPFCRRAEAEAVKSKLSQRYRVHIILYPLSFHKDARAMSYYILAGKTDKEKAQRFKETLAGSNAWEKFKPTAKQIQKFNQELAKGNKAVGELGARGTPTFYDKNFNEVSRGSLLQK